MDKELKGTTLIYDLTDGRYLRTEIYMSEDPAETVDLCVVDDEHPQFSDVEIDDSSGPWRRIIEPKKASASEQKREQTTQQARRDTKERPRESPPKEERPDRRDEPLVLEKRHRKAAPARRRTPTKVLSADKPLPANKPRPANKVRSGTKARAASRSPDKPVWVSFEAEVLNEDALLRVPPRLHLLARASGEHVEVRMRLTPNQRTPGSADTLDGLPTIGQD